MSSWSGDLHQALASGDPAFMKAMLARVPEEVLQRAVPYLEELAQANARDGKFEEAITCYDQLIQTAPDKVEWRINRAQACFKLDRLDEALVDAARISELRPEDALGYRLQAEAHEGLRDREQALAAYRQALRFDRDDTAVQQRIEVLENELKTAALLQQTLNPEARKELPPPPHATLNPALFEDPSVPEGFDNSMLGGLRQHLRRYSNHQAPTNVLDRLEDARWLALWDEALKSTAGLSTLLHGSELGTFALRALHHGASKVVAAAAHPLEGRVTSGIIQKHMLKAWHAAHGEAIQGWSDDDRRRSIEDFARNVAVVATDSEELKDAEFQCFVFPNIDHSLLGTGIVPAIREFRASTRSSNAQLLPARARIYAMGIQWLYPGTSFDLQPVNQLRWSLSPQPLDLPSTCWSPLTEAVQVGELDFERFNETVWNVRLPVRSSGELNGVVFWFELDIGGVKLSNAPDGELRCIKPAVQYTDGVAMEAGEALELQVKVTETRLYFAAQPAPSVERSCLLPSWYVPMIVDEARNGAFERALRTSLTKDVRTVLDIGAGFGLLSMMAAQSSTAQVYGCEVNRSISRVANEVVQLNELASRVTLLSKDCRSLTVPADLPERADLAVFELFDCSLIGEGILHFLAYARERLLKENARYLPRSAVVKAMIIEYRLDRVWDVDVNILNPYRFSQSFINVDASKLSYRALTDPFDVFAFDFAHATPAPEEKQIVARAIADGTAGAVLFWFDLQLDESTWLSNGPASGSRLHWKQALQFLPEVKVTRALDLPITAKHDGSGTTFRWKPDGLPREAFSTLPRFDPRSFQQVAELQMQTRSILQHCASNPEEYAKVVELAKRFAIDPAAHGVDPKIAQRFAATFFGE